VLAVTSVAVACLWLLPPVTHGDRALGPGCLAPPLVAVGVALATGQLAAALGLATLAGAVVLHGPWLALPLGLRDYVLANLSDRGHLTIIGFVLVLLGMVSVMNRSGGTGAVVALAKRGVSTRRGTRVGAAVMGCVVFFDDYANCMIVGPALRPLCDRFGISRERLAFVVDATAAPIAGLVPLSTWIGYEVGLLDGVLDTIGSPMDGYALLLTMLPYRFYCIFVLALVFASAALDRELGPMLAAERRALAARAPEVAADTDEGAAGCAPAAGDTAEPTAGSARDALVPLATLLGGVVLGFVVAGNGLPALSTAPLSVLTYDFWKATLAAVEDGPRVLLLAALAALSLSVLLPTAGGRARLGDLVAAIRDGMRVALGALGILVLAWALGKACGDVGTGAYLSALVTGALALWAIPLITFATAAGVAFATGTSWGTMAMLLPTAVPVAAALGQWWLVPVTAAAVLDGAIFGDHCSPISDTTLMSSIGAGCDHLAHVRTQLPYAVTGMSIALVAGYGATVLGVPPLVCWVVGAGLVVAVVRVLGTRVTPPTSASPAAR
jgi:Na+/H+ antiporter NhaC